MVCRVGPQHEAERKDHRRMWSQSWNIVSSTPSTDLHTHLMNIPSAGVCGIIRTKALAGLNASEYICKHYHFPHMAPS